MLSAKNRQMIFTRTFKPNHVINLNKLARRLENIRSNVFKIKQYN